MITVAIIAQNGNVGIGTTTPNNRQDVWATNAFIQTSDRRDKTNIQHLDYGLHQIMALRPVRYTWKAHPEEGEKLGLIAQELLEVIPEVVRTHDTIKDPKSGEKQTIEIDRIGVGYADLIPVLIKAIQEQQEIITSQNEDFHQLRAEVDELRSEIELLCKKNLK